MQARKTQTNEQTNKQINEPGSPTLHGFVVPATIQLRVDGRLLLFTWLVCLFMCLLVGLVSWLVSWWFVCWLLPVWLVAWWFGCLALQKCDSRKSQKYNQKH